MSLTAASMAVAPRVLAAEAWPSRPVRMVVPFTPGASNDIIGRLIGQKLSDAWGQAVLVDNRPGAGGALGAALVAKGTPDGYTLLVTNPGPTVNHVVLSAKPQFTMEELAPVIFIGYSPLIIVANPAFPPRTARELVEYAKANPGRINWGSAGSNSNLHTALEVFKSVTGIQATHVPYKGTGPSLADIAGGQIQLMFTTWVSAESLVKAGRLRVLSSLQEQGIKGADAIVWFGLDAPAKTPRAVIERINADVEKVLALPDVRARFDQLGIEVEGGPPSRYGELLKSEVARLARLVKAGALQVE
ncbi:MAG: tripartite tricarboxylate transporter substrate-binding protein [Proteobacteria bacterium]|nr:tripartite tricarboxylate transporter substrate-binding protein [Pseudomonadota bacterium]